jgi:hypothetical protein
MQNDPKPKSVFINQLDGGYTINLQGNNFYPVKVCVTIEEVKTIINDFFNAKEVQNPTPNPETAADSSENLLH